LELLKFMLEVDKAAVAAACPDPEQPSRKVDSAPLQQLAEGLVRTNDFRGHSRLGRGFLQIHRRTETQWPF